MAGFMIDESADGIAVFQEARSSDLVRNGFRGG